MAYRGYWFKNCGSALSYLAYLEKALVSMGWEEWDVLEATKAWCSLELSGGGYGYFTAGDYVTIGGTNYYARNTVTSNNEFRICSTLGDTLRCLGACVNKGGWDTAEDVDWKASAANSKAEAYDVIDQTGGPFAIYFRALVEGPWASVAYNDNIASSGHTVTNVSGGYMQGGHRLRVCYRSNGESGKEPYGYIYIDTDYQETSLYFQVCQYWDKVNHVAYRPTYGVSSSQKYAYINAFNVANECVIAGNKDLVGITANRSGGNSSGATMLFGHLQRFIPHDNTYLTVGVTAGAHVSLPVADSTGFYVGSLIQIVGTMEGCDPLLIEAVPDGTHVVVRTLPRNYGSGAVIGRPASLFGYMRSNESRWYFCSFWSDSGLSQSASVSNYGTPITNDVPTYKSLFTNQSTLSPVAFNLSGLGNYNYAWVTLFWFSHSNNAANWDIALANDDKTISVGSQATGAGATSISDSAKSWTVNEHAGKYVVIYSGTGADQLRKILSNTADTLTVENWTTQPDGTSYYKICDKAYRYWYYIVTGLTTVLLTDFSAPT